MGRTIGQGHNTRIGARVVESETKPDVARIQYAAVTFLGISANQYDFNNVADVGDRMFNNYLYTWYINTGPNTWTAGNAAPPRYIGWWHSQALGDEHVRGVGDIFYVQGETQMWVVTGFVPGETVYGYHWVTPQEIINLLDRNDIPDGTEDGQGVIWNNGRYEPGRLTAPGDSFPHVGQLPTATATSPELVYLEHAYTEGIRQDGILRIGTDGNFAGYIDSRLWGGSRQYQQARPCGADSGGAHWRHYYPLG